MVIENKLDRWEKMIKFAPGHRGTIVHELVARSSTSRKKSHARAAGGAAGKATIWIGSV